MAKNRDLPRLNLHQHSQSQQMPSFSPAMQQSFVPPPFSALQTPMQGFFPPQGPPPGPGRPIHHHHASMQLAVAGIHPPTGFQMTPVSGHFTRPSLMIPAGQQHPFGPIPVPGPGAPGAPSTHHGPPFPHRNRRQLSIGGPPKAVLGGPARKTSPMPVPPTTEKTKKVSVKLPKETIPGEDGEPSMRAEWARNVADHPVDYQEVGIPLPDVSSAEPYPPDSWRLHIPNAVDVFLPGKLSWEAIKQQVIEEKLEALGVERGSGSNASHIYAPHARSASISSPADPGLLLFKLNKLQQAQDSASASGVNSLLTSPQPPFFTPGGLAGGPSGLSPSPHQYSFGPSPVPPFVVTNRHGHSLSLAQPPLGTQGYTSFGGTNSILHDDSLSEPSPIRPGGRGTLGIATTALANSLMPPPLSAVGGVASAPGSRPDSRPDFIRGFGLDIPEEPEEEEKQNAEFEAMMNTRIKLEQAIEDQGESEQKGGDSDSHGADQAERIKHKSRPSVALTLRSVDGVYSRSPSPPLRSGRSFAHEAGFGDDFGPIELADDEEEDKSLSRDRSRSRSRSFVEGEDQEAIEEWTGSEDMYDEVSDDESIGEWSNPSDEERARQVRAIRRTRRRQQSVQIPLAEIPRRIPNFPRPPENAMTIAESLSMSSSLHQPGHDNALSRVSHTHRSVHSLAFGGMAPVPASQKSYEEEDIISNPSDDEHYQHGLAIPHDHSRIESTTAGTQLSPHDPALAHSRVSSVKGIFDGTTNYKTQQPSELSLNPLAKPFVFGAPRQQSWEVPIPSPTTRAPVTPTQPSPTQLVTIPTAAALSASGTPQTPSFGHQGHSRNSSFGRHLNVAAPEFKPGGFTFRAPPAAPLMPQPQHYEYGVGVGVGTNGHYIGYAGYTDPYASTPTVAYGGYTGYSPVHQLPPPSQPLPESAPAPVHHLQLSVGADQQPTQQDLEDAPFRGGQGREKRRRTASNVDDDSFANEEDSMASFRFPNAEPTSSPARDRNARSRAVPGNNDKATRDHAEEGGEPAPTFSLTPQQGTRLLTSSTSRESFLDLSSAPNSGAIRHQHKSLNPSAEPFTFAGFSNVTNGSPYVPNFGENVGSAGQYNDEDDEVQVVVVDEKRPEVDNMATFVFPPHQTVPTAMLSVKPSAPGTTSSAPATTSNASNNPHHSSADSNDPTADPIVTANARNTSTTSKATGGANRQKRAPIPLDFKQPISNNTVPAGLFKAVLTANGMQSNSPRMSLDLVMHDSFANGENSNNGTERTRRTVRSRLSSHDLLEHDSRPSMDDNDLPRISAGFRDAALKEKKGARQYRTDGRYATNPTSSNRSRPHLHRAEDMGEGMDSDDDAEYRGRENGVHYSGNEYYDDDDEDVFKATRNLRRHSRRRSSLPDSLHDTQERKTSSHQPQNGGINLAYINPGNHFFANGEAASKDGREPRALVAKEILESLLEEKMRNLREELKKDLKEAALSAAPALPASTTSGSFISAGSSATAASIAAATTSLEAQMNEIVSLFRAQLTESATRGLMDDDVQLQQVRGEMDLQLLKDAVEQGHRESIELLRKELDEVIDRLWGVRHGNGAVDGKQQGEVGEKEDPIPIIRQVGERTIQAVADSILDLQVRLETMSKATSSHERDEVAERVVNTITPILHALHADATVDYTLLTERLTQAVKPHISQLIDLASDKRETAVLIVNKLIPALPQLITASLPAHLTSGAGQQPPVDVAALTTHLTAEVRKAIGLINVFEIKEGVADLVLERLDSRLAVRDKNFNVESVSAKVSENVVASIVESLNANLLEGVKKVVEKVQKEQATLWKVEQEDKNFSVANDVVNGVVGRLNEDRKSLVQEITEGAVTRVLEGVKNIVPNVDVDALTSSLQVAVAEGLKRSAESQGDLVKDFVGRIEEELNSSSHKLEGLLVEKLQATSLQVSQFETATVNAIEKAIEKTTTAVAEAVIAALPPVTQPHTGSLANHPDENVAFIKEAINGLVDNHKGLSRETSAISSSQRDIINRLATLPASFATATTVLQDSHADFVSARDQMRRDLDELRKQNTEHQVQLSKARGAHGQIRVEKDVLTEKLSVVEAEKDKLKVQKMDLDEEIGIKRAEAETLRKRNEELEGELEKALAKLKVAVAGVQQGQNKIGEVEKANRELTNERQGLKNKVESLNMQVVFANKDKETVTQTLLIVQEQYDQLLSQQSHWEELRQAHEKIDQLALAVNKARDEDMNELRRFRERCLTAESQLASAQKRLADQESKITNSERAASTVRQNLTLTQQRATDAEKKTSELEGQLELTCTKLEQAEQIHSQLDTDFNSLRAQLEEKEAAEHSTKINEVKLREQIASLEGKVAKLQTDLEHAKTPPTPKIATVHLIPPSNNVASPSPYKKPIHLNNGYPIRPDSRTSVNITANNYRASSRFSQASRDSNTPSPSHTSNGVWESMHTPSNPNSVPPYPPYLHNNPAQSLLQGGRVSPIVNSTQAAAAVARAGRYPSGLASRKHTAGITAPYARNAPSPAPSTVSLAPTQDDEGWWS